MKASDRGRNVKFLGNNFGCVLSQLTNINFQPDESIQRVSEANSEFW